MATIELEEQLIPRESSIELPEIQGGIYRLLESTYQPTAVFDFAQSEWQKIFVADEIINTITWLANAADQTESDKLALKEKLLLIKLLRKPGTRLVDAWRLLNTGNQFPKSLSSLVDTIGKYKDMFWYSSQRGRITDQLQGQIQDYEASENLQFEPLPFESFKDTYNRYISDIISYINEPNLTLHYFHKLRYRVRTLRHYFALNAAATGNTQMKVIADFLEPISFEMGKSQDQIHKMKVHGQVDIYQDSAIVSPRHLQIITEFLAKHNQ